MVQDTPELKEYQQGWLDGAAGRDYPKPTGNSDHYLAGHFDGSKGWIDAMFLGREKYNLPLTSTLDDVNQTEGEVK